MKTKLMTLVITLALAAPALVLAAPGGADDIVRRVNFAIVNPGEALAGSLAEYTTSESLASVAWLRAQIAKDLPGVGGGAPTPAVCPRPLRAVVTVSDPSANPVGHHTAQAMGAVSERDVIIAILFEKVMLAEHPDLDPEVRKALAWSVDVAKLRHFVVTAPIE